MNILIATRYFDDRNAGIGVYSENLLEEMKKKEKTRIVPVSTSTEGRVGYFFYTAIGLAFRPRRVANDSAELVGRGGKIDVHHALTPMESIWMPKDQTVVTFHDLFPLYMHQQTWYGGNPITSFISSKWFEMAVKHAIQAERLISNSEQTKQNVVEKFGVDPEKFTVTRMGINQDLVPLDVDYDTYRIGTLSFFDPRKRIDLLIKAFKKIDNPNAELLIPSTGPQREYLRSLGADDERIHFLGYLPEEQKVEFLNSLDVFVQPSRLEGYGIPIIEAMACKVPVVTLEDALIPFDVKDKTHTISKGNLAKLLSEQDFDCNIDKNYEFAQEHDWEKCAEKTKQVYEEVNNA